MKTNVWLDGIMGLVVGDALGCPVQFLSRKEIRARGLVKGMEGYGTYNMPEGTWTDDSSMALASMDSIIHKKEIDPEDTMKNFMKWEFDGDYTPFGQAFDQGNTCSSAIWKFRDTGDYRTCGKTGEYANGNGALMRILPVCLFYIEDETKQKARISGNNLPVQNTARNHSANSDQDYNSKAIQGIHTSSGLTHNHLRSQMACGLYYFLAKEIVKGKDTSHTEDKKLNGCLQKGMDAGLKFYGRDEKNYNEMRHFTRLFYLDKFADTPEDDIQSSGYVVDSFEAAIWCLITTGTFKDCLLKAVNLGDDTDTVAAIAGGLAGLYYGYDNIPADWLAVIKEREYVEDMCRRCNSLWEQENLA